MLLDLPVTTPTPTAGPLYADKIDTALTQLGAVTGVPIDAFGTDPTSLQEAATLSAGDGLYLPPGSWNLGATPLALPNTRLLYGPGTLQQTEEGVPNVDWGGNEDFTVVGTIQRGIAGRTGIASGNTAFVGDYPKGGLILGTHFYDLPAGAWWFRGGQDLWAVACRIERCGRGTRYTGCSDWWEFGLKMSGFTNANSWSNGTFADSTDGHSFGICHKGHIISPEWLGMRVGLSCLLHSSDKCEIVGGVSEDVLCGPVATPFNDADTCKDIKVTGHTYDGTTVALPSTILGMDTPVNYGIAANGSPGCKVVRMTVQGCTVRFANVIVKAPYQGGIGWAYADLCNDENNHVTYPTGNGHVVNNPCLDLRMAGGTVDNVQDDGAGNRFGVTIGDAAVGSTGYLGGDMRLVGPGVTAVRIDLSAVCPGFRVGSVDVPSGSGWTNDFVNGANVEKRALRLLTGQTAS